MKTIGILGKNIDDSFVFNYKYINKFNNVNCIGLFSSSDLSMCDGFFIQGGKNIESWYYDVISYAIKERKPILGICLGCQVLGTYFDGTLKNHKNHLKTNHYICLTKQSFLSFLGDKFIVNSRHEEVVDKLSSFFEIIAVANDGVIEAIRYKDTSLFIVGIQWHPEDLTFMDFIFDKFMSEL